jgi:hypothetical protein
MGSGGGELLDIRWGFSNRTIDEQATLDILYVTFINLPATNNMVTHSFLLEVFQAILNLSICAGWPISVPIIFLSMQP